MNPIDNKYYYRDIRTKYFFNVSDSSTEKLYCDASYSDLGSPDGSVYRNSFT